MLTGLLKVQAGDQGTVWATAATDTVRLMGITAVEWDGGIVSERITDEMRGDLYPAHTGYVSKVAPTFKISGFWTPEDGGYWLDSLFGKATPSGGGGGTVPYTYAYAATGTALALPRIQTLYYGDSAGTKCYKMTGAIVNKLTLKAENTKHWEFEAEGVGYQVVSGASFASLANRTVTVCTAAQTTISVDAAAATIGSTSFAATAFNFDVSIENKRNADFYMGGLTAGGHHENKWDGKIKIHVEYNALSATLIEDQHTASPAVQRRLIRASFDNSAAAAANRLARIDFAGQAPNSPKVFNDMNGLVSFDWEADGFVDTGAFANWCKAAVINNTSALA